MANINGTAGNDTLHDTSGNDVIKGGLGDDTITVSSGIDTVDGGGGTDTLVVDYGAATDAIYTLDKTGASNALTNQAGVLSGYFYDGYNANTVQFTGVEKLSVTTGSGDDHLDLSTTTTASHVTTNDGNDSVYGGTGADTISTGAGDDYVQFHLGSTVDLGTGNNGISLDASSLTTAVAIDALHGAYSGIAGLTGYLAYVGDLTTGSGNDTISLPGSGYGQAVHTGAGNDAVTLSQGDGSTGEATVDLGPGDDTLTIDDSSYTAALVTYYDTVYNPGTANDPNGFSGALYEQGYGYAQSFTGAEHFNITGGSGDDHLDFSAVGTPLTINGGEGNNYVGGGDGGNRLTAGSGDDTIYSGAGADTIDAGEGNNFVDSGLGADTVTTGSGDDYVSALGAGAVVHLGDGYNGVSLDRSDATGPISVNAGAETYSGITGLAGTLDYLGTFYSGSGDDTFDLRNNDHNLTLHTGAGNDRVYVDGNQNSAVVSGGAGDDTLSIDDSGIGAAIVTYYGTVYNPGATDDPNGFSGALYEQGYGYIQQFDGIEHFNITGGSGDDHLDFSAVGTPLTINGGEGNNYVGGGDGGNQLTAGSGDDTIYSGAGADTIDAGEGNNFVDSGLGADTVTTGAGDDYVSALGAGAVVHLGDGYNGVSLDRSDATGPISVNAGAETYSGITGLTGTLDYLGTFYSGSGDDTFDLRNNDHNLTLDTGAGNDRVYVDGNQNSAVVSGGAGDDTLSIDDSGIGAALVTYYGTVYNPGATDDPNGFSGALYEQGYGYIQQFDGIEHFAVTTGSGDDHLDFSQVTTPLTINAGEGANYVGGGTGNDSLTTGSGSDTIYGGGGADTIHAGAGDDFVSALGLNSVVDLGTGVNGVSLDRSNATKAISIDIPHGTYSGIAGLTGTLSYLGEFHAGSGNDSILTGPNSTASVYGGGGNDTIGIGGLDSANGVGGFAYGGSGTDTLIIDDSSAIHGIVSNIYNPGNPADPNGFSGSYESSFYESNQYFDGIEKFNITTGSGNDSLLGGSGADTLSTGAGADTLDGGAGIDKLIGGAGNDTYYVDNAKDQIVENPGEGTLDTVYASSPTYVLSANIEVLHYSGSDTFIGTGNAQNNAIYADNAIAATLHGAAGNDTLYGGNGNDSLYGEGGHDVIYGGGGNDYIRSLTGEGSVTINGGAGNDLLTLERTDATANLKVDLTIVGNQAVGEGTVFQSIEQIRFAGGSGNDYERGGGSDDVLKGNGGDDTLIGGAGNDVLEGGDQNDLTRRGLPDGHDSLTGGTGADTFRFDAPLAGADDIVTDFTTGVDKVALSTIGFGIHSTADFDIVSSVTGPTEAKATLVVDLVNHTISWDADGTGSGAGVLLAHGAFTVSPADYTVF